MRVLLLIVTILLFTISAYADVKTIHTEWEFGGTADSFRLYQEGALIYESFDTTTLAINCEADLKVGDNIFTMTAMTTDGETPHSAPFTLVYTVPVVDPIITQPQLVIKSVEIIE